MTEDKKYPIAEIFTSPQGEGVYTGYQMTFVRTAGCTVGKPFPKERYNPARQCKNCSNSETVHSDATFRRTVCNNFQPSGFTMVKALPAYTECCTLYDGRQFECDTDYKGKERLSREEILERVPKGISHLCITGGEPFMHNLLPLAALAISKGLIVHVETSGTLPLHRGFDDGIGNHRPSWTEQECWITVSPKMGVLPEMLIRANEVKLLVDEKFDLRKVPGSVFAIKRPVYIQPVNFEHTINEENMKRCLQLQKDHPELNLIISSQQHKLWGVR